MSSMPAGVLVKTLTRALPHASEDGSPAGFVAERIPGLTGCNHRYRLRVLWVSSPPGPQSAALCRKHHTSRGSQRTGCWGPGISRGGRSMTTPRQSSTTAVHLADPAFTVVVTVAKDGATSPAPHKASSQRSSASHSAPSSPTNDASLNGRGRYRGGGNELSAEVGRLVIPGLNVLCE